MEPVVHFVRKDLRLYGAMETTGFPNMVYNLEPQCVGAGGFGENLPSRYGSFHITLTIYSGGNNY